jgi:hypothetical protein
MEKLYDEFRARMKAFLDQPAPEGEPELPRGPRSRIEGDGRHRMTNPRLEQANG